MSQQSLRQAVRNENPHLSPQQVDDLLGRAAEQERSLVLKDGLSLEKARELVNQSLFPSQNEPTFERPHKTKTPA